MAQPMQDADGWVPEDSFGARIALVRQTKRWNTTEAGSTPVSRPMERRGVPDGWGGDQPMGPGWWQASDGRWYPPTEKGLEPPEVPTPTKASGPGGCLIMTVLFVLGFGGCAALTLAVGDDDKPDASAEFACEHFRGVARSFSEGTMTVGELRGELQEIDDDAEISDEPGIASGSTAMLRAITQGNDAALADAIASFGAACTALDL